MEHARGKRLLLILIIGVVYSLSKELYRIFDAKIFELVVYFLECRKWSIMKHLYDIRSYVQRFGLRFVRGHIYII